jgi:hypothetical protein
MEKYIMLFGKKYLRCAACCHFNSYNSRCKLFDCWCASDDGCTEEFIQEKELELCNAEN